MDLEELLEDVSELISLPEVAIRIAEVVDDPTGSADSIAEVVAGDPSLTARLLKIANSPYYGSRSTIETVSRAVTVLGASQVRDLSLGLTATRALKGIPTELISMDTFWMHSIYCGIIAGLLADESGAGGGSEATFIAGLLHDIGQLVIFNKLPELSRQALLLSVEGPADLSMDAAEREVMSFDHTEVGGELARMWGLPQRLHDCLKFHHDPAKAPHFPEAAAIVHIANSLAVLAELDSSSDYDAPPIDPAAWEIANLHREIVPNIIVDAQQRFSDIKSLFML